MASLTEIPHIASFIRNCTPVSDSTLELLATSLSPCTFPKRALLIREGKAEGVAFFIEEGMTRSYWLVDGQEITTSFSTEGAIVFSMDELYYGRLSEEFVEAVEPMQCFRISLDTLRTLLNENLELTRWWAILHQNEYRRLHRSHKDRLTLSAAARYEQFRLQFPEVNRRARLTDIASYLGITLSTLSRIRKI